MKASDFIVPVAVAVGCTAFAVTAAVVIAAATATPKPPQPPGPSAILEGRLCVENGRLLLRLDAPSLRWLQAELNRALDGASPPPR